MKKNLPQIKKSVNSFLIGEEGKISKQSIIKLGTITVLASAAAINVQAGMSCPDPTGIGLTPSDVTTSTSTWINGNPCGFTEVQELPRDDVTSRGSYCHENSMAVEKAGNSIRGEHNHCVGIHASHTSHGNHGNHGSGCSSVTW